MEKKLITIAIDGFSSSGKSTMAKVLAKNIGYAYIDTGAMYRAVTLYSLEHGAVVDGEVQQDKVVELLPQIEISFRFNAERGASDIYVNGVEVEQKIDCDNIDLNQIYAQLKAGLQAGKPYWFSSEEEEERWSVIVKKFVEDNQLNTPLNGRGDNPTLAMVCYFYEKWKKEPGLLVPNKTQTILNFFTQKCGLPKSTTDKNICNRINEYLKGNRKFEKFPHIKERVYRIFSDYKLEKITSKKKV